MRTCVSSSNGRGAKPAWALSRPFVFFFFVESFMRERGFTGYGKNRIRPGRPNRVQQGLKPIFD